MIKDAESDSWMADLTLRGIGRLEEKTIGRLRSLVEIESPSDDKAAVDRCGEAVAAMASELGGKARRHRQREAGDVLEVRFRPVRRVRGSAPVMLLGHLDTVWPLGTLKTMPFRVEEGRVWGPGTLDMKAGVAMALTALEWLRET